ncbi:MAG: hypothetical protein R3C46_07100 [Hyphomonadaceae bacterium]
MATRMTPMRMALSNTAEGGYALGNTLLGSRSRVVLWGYEASLWASMASMAVALAISVWKMDEPRRRR